MKKRKTKNAYNKKVEEREKVEKLSTAAILIEVTVMFMKEISI